MTIYSIKMTCSTSSQASRAISKPSLENCFFGDLNLLIQGFPVKPISFNPQLLHPCCPYCVLYRIFVFCSSPPPYRIQYLLQVGDHKVQISLMAYLPRLWPGPLGLGPGHSHDHGLARPEQQKCTVTLFIINKICYFAINLQMKYKHFKTKRG